MKKFMLDTNALIAIIDEKVIFTDFSDIYITSWCAREFITFFKSSKEFISHDIEEQEKILNARKSLLKKIPLGNIISTNYSWTNEIETAFRISKSDILKKRGINDVMLVALSERPNGKEFIFVFSGDEKCKQDIQNSGCISIDFSEFKKLKSL